MVKIRSRDVMKSRKNHPERVRVEFTVHVDVKDQFERLYKVNRLTRPELFTRMVQAGLPDNEQTTNTLPCSPEHLEKLNWLADCYAVTMETMLERLIDTEHKALERQNKIYEAHSSTTNPEMARFLYELFEGDRMAAYQGYKKFLYGLYPGWVYISANKKTDPKARRFDGVDKALWTCDRKAKAKADTPEEIPA
jgi:hypothetical protein